jgi:hypothetical protein
MSNCVSNQRCATPLVSVSRWFLAAASLIVMACKDSPPATVEPVAEPSALQSAVVGAAAAALGPDGKFVFAATTGVGRFELGAEEAGALSAVWLRRYAPMVRENLEKDHGGPLRLSELRQCGRPLYARSPVDPPPDSIPAPFARPFGPWWLVTFCAGKIPSVSVAISAWANELKLDNGALRFPPISGNEFVAIGIPSGHNGEFPSAPEDAVAFVAGRYSRRIAAVPELVMPLNSVGLPQNARWRLRLERSVTVRTTRALSETDELYVMSASTRVSTLVTAIASSDQPSSIAIEWWKLPSAGEAAEAYLDRSAKSRTEALVPRRVDSAIRLDNIIDGGR